MTGNYRQLVYIMRYQVKRCRYILLSFVNVQHRFRSTVWRITQKVYYWFDYIYFISYSSIE
jgi:hypothetical protein